MRMTLQDMVSRAISTATEREKIAQAAEEAEEKKAPDASAKKEEKEEKEKESAGYKCASVETGVVEKVASALDFINANLDQIDWEKVAVGEGLGTQKANAPEPMVGVAKGPTTMQTNMDDPTGGMQSTETGQAKNNQPEAAGSKDDVGKTDGQTNAETAMLTDMNHVPGGTGEQPQLKQASIKLAREKWAAMKKQAADAENPAKIEAGREPLENPNASASEEGVPKLPPPAQRQANMVQTKDPTAPADITKREAKAEDKRQMGEVLTEPAQRKSTDPVLHANLAHAESAGVKLSSAQAAAARNYLRKLAQAGEDENASPEEKEKAKKLQEAVAKKKEEKEKESQMMTPTPTPTPAPVTPLM